MSPRLRWRKFVSGFMLTMTGVCALVAVSVLFFILGYLIYHGGTSINGAVYQGGRRGQAPREMTKNGVRY